MLNIVSVSLGVLIALAFVATIVYGYLQEINQKKHAILRNFRLSGDCAICSSNSANTADSIFLATATRSGQSFMQIS